MNKKWNRDNKKARPMKSLYIYQKRRRDTTLDTNRKRILWMMFVQNSVPVQDIQKQIEDKGEKKTKEKNAWNLSRIMSDSGR